MGAINLTLLLYVRSCEVLLVEHVLESCPKLSFQLGLSLFRNLGVVNRNYFPRSGSFFWLKLFHLTDSKLFEFTVSVDSKNVCVAGFLVDLNLHRSDCTVATVVGKGKLFFVLDSVVDLRVNVTAQVEDSWLGRCGFLLFGGWLCLGGFRVLLQLQGPGGDNPGDISLFFVSNLIPLRSI